MKRKLILGFIFIFMLSACGGTQTIQNRTETMVISYETIGTLAFPTVRAYIQQREANGSLVGDKLVLAKAQYNQAVDKFVEAGDLVKNYISFPKTTPIANLPLLLRSVAILLADLSGGSVQGNTLTVPVAGGSK